MSEEIKGLVSLIVLASSIWVIIDAKKIGVKRGQLQGLFNMGPWGWFFVCLFIWIVGFPVYLVKRSKYKQINGMAMANWFYMKDGVPIGPISDEVFQQLTRAGQIRPTDLIRRETSNNWVQAQEIQGIIFHQAL